ncbi:MAG: helix-turn-helix domain-containing protein [Pseudanabaenaceae cyanobacterium SKYGB_i_bin29]|nr:helix-turn-helix domain-containing protein [Pseudanabaenaceae cyanobacterium SKYG29]MDW8421663.1 helix-turn-helix domain-containing protein [Pseudanabaenaceae cyanobacterium SKYGB_i_bin29]
MAMTLSLVPDRSKVDRGGRLQDFMVTPVKDALWEWNLLKNTINFSLEWKAMLGYRDAEIGNSPVEWLHRIHPEDVEAVRSRLTAHFNGQTPDFQSEHRLLHRDGSYRWVRVRGHTLTNGEGVKHIMVGFQIDLTPYRQSLSTIQMQRVTIEPIADAIPFPALIMTEPEGTILYFNQQCEELFPQILPADCFDPRGLPYKEFFPQSPPLNGKPCSHDIQTKDSGQWLRAHIYPLTDHLQGLYLTCLVDITEHKQVELDLNNFLASTKVDPPIQPSLTKVFSFIEANYREGIALKDVAKAVGYSPAYLTSMVQQATGKTVNQWITEYRMAEARLLLLKTNQSIQQIAMSVGYKSVEHFIRQFRQNHNQTPQVWRKEHLKQLGHGQKAARK